MRYQLRHLLSVIAVFAVFLVVGIPRSFVHRTDTWKVVSIDQEQTSRGRWDLAHPSSNADGTPVCDYVVTLRNDNRTRTINLGDTVYLSQHGLKLPEVGSYIAFPDRTFSGHGFFPFVPAQAPSPVGIALAGLGSFLCAVALVAIALSIQWFVRRQVHLHRERRWIDRSARPIN